MKRATLLLVLFFLVGCGKSEPNNESNPDASTDMGTSDVSPNDQGTTDVAVDMGMPCSPVFLGPDDEPFDTLAEWCLFSDELAQTPNTGVLPFVPVSVLYADESLKLRYVAVPAGKTIVFDAEDRWEYPAGTILVKSFFFYNDARDQTLGRRLFETRLLVKRAAGWEPYIYVWDEAQTEARFQRLGDWIDFDRIDEEGESVSVRYRVPNKNQCNSCHEQNDVTVPLGPRAFQLNSDLDFGGDVGTVNQLRHWEASGLITGVPGDLSSQFTLTDYLDPGADLNGRARSYLEVNCAHCHGQGGAADPSGLKLSVTITEPGEFGICRRPVAAGAGSGGYFFDIVPGEPENSIMLFRMASIDPEIKMPELPTQTADDFGVQLITQWIGAMSPVGCVVP